MSPSLKDCNYWLVWFLKGQLLEQKFKIQSKSSVIVPKAFHSSDTGHGKLSKYVKRYQARVCKVNRWCSKEEIDQWVGENLGKLFCLGLIDLIKVDSRAE